MMGRGRGRGRRVSRAGVSAAAPGRLRGAVAASSIASADLQSPSYSPQHSRSLRDIASTPISNRPGQSPPLFEDDSPSHNSPSPIPFLSTQDGSHGENDVIWDYYSPASRKETSNNTPLRKRRVPIYYDHSPISRISSKKKFLRHGNIKKDFFEGLKDELVTINKHVQELISSDSNTNSEKGDGDVDIALTPVRKDSDRKDSIPDDSILNAILECNQTAEVKYKNMQPFKAHITDKISKCNNEAIESDDSMNEYLLKASQMVEDEFQNSEVTKSKVGCQNQCLIRLEHTNLKNDSFDNLICGINDSYIDILSQACNNIDKNKFVNENQNKFKQENMCTIQKEESENCNVKHYDRVSKTSEDTFNLSSLLTNSILNDSKSKFSRHNSMPVSPSMKCNQNLNNNRKSTFSRHKSMPTENQTTNYNGVDGSQNISCTPEEIRKKHQAAKEKLLSKIHESQVPRKIIPQSGLLKNINTITNNAKNIDKLHNNLKENTAITSKNNTAMVSNNRNINTSLKSSLNQTKTKDLRYEKRKIQAEIERKRREAIEKLQRKKLCLIERNRL
ncbi:uncharacterized protein LOC143913226 [Arctopsyche grandis]|uniref:uncharacterized protein LOC143913226 n=1 Tax=Arctopsyche grandis TaxID=121162 RepID=UPI00406D9343